MKIFMLLTVVAQLLCVATVGAEGVGACSVRVSGSQNGTVNGITLAIWDKTNRALTLECRLMNGTTIVTIGARMQSPMSGTYAVLPVKKALDGGAFGGSLTLLYGPGDKRNGVYQTSSGKINLSGEGGNVRARGEFRTVSFWGRPGTVDVEMDFVGPIVGPEDIHW